MHEATNKSNFTHHEPCPSCGSKDNLARYDDGHGHCFGCGHYIHSNGLLKESPSKRIRLKEKLGLISGEVRALPKRNITEETCRKFAYECGEMDEKKVQIANYQNADGELVAQKIRFANKDFTTTGDLSQAELFGSHLWSSGKKIVVTEGEIDCLTVSQVQNHKWPVVSIPNGAQGAKKSLQKHLDYFDPFDEVILMFDMDEPGKKAAKECAQLFPPGKCKIASLSLKDPNELLKSNRGDEIISAIWNAKPYRPDGVISGEDLWESVKDDNTRESIPYPWDALNKKTLGLRTGELVTFTAGSGIGKSAIVREIAYNLLMGHKQTVGMVMLEEATRHTALGMMSINLNKPLHLSREGVSEEKLKESFRETVGNGRLYLYDHWGSTEIDNLLSKIRYLTVGCGCKWIILDHLSIVVSGLGDGDERRLIDNAMTKLRTLVEETGMGLILVSHLKRPEGKGHEEGAQTSLSQLRGSAAIAQLSDIVIGAERDQQGKTPNLTTLRVLKNRYSGDTGQAGYLSYDKSTGRLQEAEGEFFGDESLPENNDF